MQPEWIEWLIIAMEVLMIVLFTVFIIISTKKKKNQIRSIEQNEKEHRHKTLDQKLSNQKGDRK